MVSELCIEKCNIILKNVNKSKGGVVYTNKDFSREKKELRKKLWDELKQLRLEVKYLP